LWVVLCGRFFPTEDDQEVFQQPATFYTISAHLLRKPKIPSKKRTISKTKNPNTHQNAQKIYINKKLTTTTHQMKFSIFCKYKMEMEK
jgi:hypothetical protein